MSNKQTPADAGYRVVEMDDDHLLVEDVDDGKRELFMRSDGFAGWGLRHAGHDWEFVTSSLHANFTLKEKKR